MPAMVAGILIGILLLSLLLMGGRTARAGAGGPPTVPVTGASAREIKALSRAEIARRLRELADRPAPRIVDQGAMCYDMAEAPDHATYVCPRCGERTLHAVGTAGWSHPMIDSNISAIRALVKELKKSGIGVDGSQYCKKCSPDVRTPQLVLHLELEDSPAPHRLAGVTLKDLELLKAFLAGRDTVSGGMDGDKPLRDHLGRLQELLGVSLQR
ncbi:MAG: hypothetical protein HY815_09015 [Candidatus Riflebacteria bacterium]|nr:hypothetical protein [Candidatus Riflebacteria bacterium]